MRNRLGKHPSEGTGYGQAERRKLGLSESVRWLCYGLKKQYIVLKYLLYQEHFVEIQFYRMMKREIRDIEKYIENVS